MYTPMNSAREIWNSLQEKYTAEKEGADKFITFKFFEFTMEDNVSILDQVHEFLILVSKFKNLNIEIPEKLMVGAIITKLPYSWHNYRKKLMHTLEDFTLDHIQKHLRIKEETRIREKNLNGASSSKVNYVDSGKNSKGNDKKRKGACNSSKDNKKDKKPLSEVVCYKCVEQVDTTEFTATVSEINIGMIQELHMANVSTTNDWWYDSGATTHVCNNKDLFKTYKETEDGHEVMMGDNHTLKVIGSGNVEIQFTYGKKLTLMNVLHVPNIRKNLVFGFKLCKSGLIHQRTTPYTPQQKGVTERKNRVLQDMVNALLVSTDLPKNLWGEALLTACHVNSNIIVESRDVDFFKNKFRHDSTSTNEIVTQIPQDISDLNLNSNNNRNMAEYSSAPRRSDNDNNVINKIPVLLNVEDAPKTYKKAITSMNSAFWKEAIYNEIDSIISNNNWELSYLPPDSKAIKCTWVFRIKYHTDRSIQTFKARPDIAYVVCKLSRYTSNLSQDHWKAIGRVLAYLKRTKQLALYYDRFPGILEGYSDASWITGSSDSKSTTGWFLLGVGVVSWGSKIQTCITHSTIEAEFLALAAAGKEAEWLRNMLLGIEWWPQPTPAIFLHCYSQSTLFRAYNKVYNGKSRHISLRHAYIKELISNGIITTEYIRSCKNLADPFIKGLPLELQERWV
ncbi:zinc finger, CCHC-type containing protein [Tanacetum coccineum]